MNSERFRDGVGLRKESGGNGLVRLEEKRRLARKNYFERLWKSNQKKR